MSTEYHAGYEPNTFPFEVDPTHRNNSAIRIKSEGWKLVASAITFETVTVGSMLRHIEDNRNVFQKIALVGPLVLCEEVVPGNAIGVYERES